ncbi:uncharacterized protein LOC124397086 isoform X2 [Silurus meridionalis]|uniref:uncharacterized protein LOC124397086 isoform X2 n=1 Tax=Silurus meridionalis TaxID=175797 RepID=UPI001EEBEDBF|nr:uncharacterized protein LOC124397086 isoform X2 [Silurus meridionalis]
MKGKIWAFWIFLAGVFTARESHTACIKSSFKLQITDQLFVDHWFQVKNFTPTSQEVTVEHEFLSFINTICSSLLLNQQFYREDPLSADMRGKVVWMYVEILRLLVNKPSWRKNQIMQFCHDHTCPIFYVTSFINTIQLENIYRKVCDWNETVPECPIPHSFSVTPTSTPPTSHKQISSTQTDGHDLSVKNNSDALMSREVSPNLVLSELVIIIIIIIIFIIFFFFSFGLYLHGYRCNNQNNCQNQNPSEAPVENGACGSLHVISLLSDVEVNRSRSLD